ncbi:biotin/lipoyl-containing protein [Tellurirhabdus rosea]|uniref:biotin/lipoyl-containing protein n=1 Tax=Tellurirhabdus rosea TaxID=2674997 RepID=UPI002250CAAA|nr:biotin/lipoyl-containing protein [Tellurirhabdus rosea]
MYRATVNESDTFDIEFTAGQPVLNGEPLHWDLARINNRQFHLLHENKSYSAELLSLDAAEKAVTLKINGHLHTVRLKDRFDLLLQQMGMESAGKAKVNDIKAPMPGLILSVAVRVGDAVQKGDTVLILEAMKMENVIKAPGDGTVKAVRAGKGESVEKNQVLIEFN